MRLRTILLVTLVLFCSVTAFAAKKPNLDALAKKPKKEYRELTPDEKQLVKQGSKVHVEERLGVPTFVWAAPGASPAQPSLKRDPESEARRHLGKYATLYGLKGDEVASLVSAGKHDTGRGVVLVTLRPQVGNVEVFREQLTVAMNANLDLLGLSGYVLGGEKDRVPAFDFALTPQDAVAVALSDLRGETISTQDLRLSDQKQGPYGFVDATASAQVANPQLLIEPARFKQVYYRLPDQLAPAYYVEVDTATEPSVDAEGLVADPTSDMYAYVISAATGEVLFRNDLTASDNYSYRVWADTTGVNQPYPEPAGSSAYPHPTGTLDGFNPPFVLPNLVTLQNGPISTNDPWLPPNALETNGNNADAYVDLITPNGFTPPTDFRANTTSANTFDRTYDTSLQPNSSETQRKAAITQLFYMNNWLHDWYYDAGFDEVSGNAQDNNYGRGGVQGDRIRAEAQDFSGLNNANMSTPADGGRPRMQMFVFTASAGLITTNSQPAGGTIPAATNNVGVSSTFGLQTFTTTADVVYATPNDGCAAISGVAGKIAFIDRGGVCGFAVKAQNAQAALAVGVIIANVSTSANPTIPPGMAGTCTPASACANVGTLSVNLSVGNLFRATLALGGTVNATIQRQPGLNRDGTIDNQIVAHEWGHYISNRLIHNSAGLTNLMGRGMGEGWADFHALLLTARPEDALVAANANWNGVWAMSGYATFRITPVQNYYFGIRRVPYSTDFTKNALTFRHISNGVPLPPVPTFPNSGPNSEVHNTGEIWATMLWESYASLLRDTQGPSPRLTFQQAQDRMTRYIVAAYKLTPVAPTLLEARDALLMAAFASDPVDGHLFCEAFARRGAGIGAVAPDRFSTNNSPVVESYVCGNDLIFDSASLSVVAQCDGDEFLDNSETARLSVTLRNVGGGTLSHTTAIVTTSNPAVSFPNGNVISFPPSDPFTTTTGAVDVGMFGASGIQNVTFTISFNDPDLAFPGPITTTFSVRANANDIPNSSATDDVESSAVVWTAAQTGAGGTPWRRLTISAFDHRWFGPNSGEPSDQYLISPVLNVAPTGDFSFSFSHRFSFEAPLFDGGVIELSTDGGATWADIGASASPTYNGTLVATGTNPIRGRKAYVNASADYPAMKPVTVSLGTTYQGQDVQVRFRIGADDNTASVGWEIDDIAFSGITNTPFHTLVAHSGSCAAGRLIIRQVESLGGPNPTINEWVELRNVSPAPLDLIGVKVCDDQALAAPAQCDGISSHVVLGGGAGVVFAADRSIFQSMHPSYAGRVLDDPSDSFLGVDGLDNNGDGVHLFEASTAASIDCMNYHNSSSCFSQGVVKDDGAETMQRTLSDATPKLRSAWFRGPEVLP